MEYYSHRPEEAGTGEYGDGQFDPECGIGVVADEPDSEYDGDDVDDDAWVESWLPDPRTIYLDLARDMLAQAGHAIDLPELVPALAEYLENGVIETLNKPAAELTFEEVGDPARHFFNCAEEGLRDGTLVTDLRIRAAALRADEIAKLGPLERRRALAEDARAAQERRAARLEELRCMLPQTFDRKAMPTTTLQAGDELTLSLVTPPAEENAATCELRGVVNGAYKVDMGDQMLHGVLITVQSEQRTSPEVFIFDQLPPGTRVVLTGTALPSNGYVNRPGQIVADQAPMLYRGGRKTLIQVRFAFDPGRNVGRNLRLDQLTVNGVKMFPDLADRRY
ncbi:MAG TPA: hypothetical protein VFM05_04310 [Candidatus Saccharimonadales bacterium]|nr:hypothetical protein [Candidatus Saccharimonadales bacterium]